MRKQNSRVIRLGRALAALTAKMEPQAAAEIAGRGAQCLAAALENPQEKDSNRISNLGRALAELVAKIESQAAAEITRRDARRLAAAFENSQERDSNDSNRLWNLGGALAALAEKIEPRAAAEIAKGLVLALENPQETEARSSTAPGHRRLSSAQTRKPFIWRKSSFTALIAEGWHCRPLLLRTRCGVLCRVNFSAGKIISPYYHPDAWHAWYVAAAQMPLCDSE
jgi:hypothetical protein